MMIKFAAALALLASSTAALAEWREARSKHFILYSEGTDKTLREAAAKLEKYDFVLRAASGVVGMDDPAPLRIYLLNQYSDVGRSMPFPSSGIAGYYTTAHHGPFAVGIRDAASGTDQDAQATLFHEYAHHFMFQYFPATYPSWYSEGFAEYYGSTRILPKDVVEVGAPQLGRYTFDYAWLPTEKLLTARSYDDVGDKLGLLYSQGWLLVHYAANNPTRQKQLQSYLRSINQGKSYQEASDAAFGPGAKALDAELHRYSGRKQLEMLRLVPKKPLEVGEITTRVMRPAEQALIWMDLKMQSGVPAGDAQTFARSVRDKAAAFPKDPYAAMMRVEAERLAGDLPAALAAAKAWLQLEPDAARPMMHVADLTIRTLPAGSATALAAAREDLLRAHRKSPDDARILLSYYQSYGAVGAPPPARAQRALAQALVLMPQDDELRYLLAADYEKRGLIAEAVATISPAAYALHTPEGKSEKEKKKQLDREMRYRLAGYQKRETAREMLTRLQAKLPATAQPAKAASAS